ncbi:TetR/AcrR family transcriptional regulator [Stakelama sp. CBK3Z-3]|uniref:TetR/AcrR family transcriptional regulator n=1 Tax=Stakelama flava TaxID=2860338 RepID=A0ABS6XRB5_9SPHN|nr:TetR/AcrR family transcriptional regulator [Stakelama flava]MBW4331951.1 TetR/AcrR family transcriptional regulator [Stakelama flava]
MTDPATAKGRRARGPSPAKTAATRRALLDAALHTFLEYGFADTRMSDVAKRAGLAKGTIYRHFDDKTALFGEVLRTIMAGAAAGSALPRPRAEEHTGDFLRRAVLPMLAQLQASGMIAVPRLVAAEGPRFPELAAVYRRVAIEPVLRIIRVYARRAERRGELRSEGLSQMPILLAAPVVVATLWNGLFASDGQLEVTAVFSAWIDLVFGNSTAR